MSLNHEKPSVPGGGNRVLGTARRGARRLRGAPGGRASTPRLALALIATAQFVLVLDITIVTVALPMIQRELGFQQAELQWLVASYALAFGGFLLLAGGAADLFGRRRLGEAPTPSATTLSSDRVQCGWETPGSWVNS